MLPNVGGAQYCLRILQARVILSIVAEDEEEHVMLYCPRFAVDRKNLKEAVSSCTSRENIVAQLLRPKANWLALSFAILRVQKELLKVRKGGKQKGAEARVLKGKSTRQSNT